jgi:hypothetical protein
MSSFKVQPINKIKQKNRHEFILPFRLAGFSLKEMKKIGYPISQRIWKSCLNSNPRNKGKILFNY